MKPRAYINDYLKEYNNITLLEDTIYNYDKLTNYFTKFKPNKIIIYDSYNNKLFPYKDIILDKNTFDLPKYHYYLNKVFGTKLSQLPFHFFIELIEDEYYIFYTRNLLMKPLIPENISPDIEKEYKDSIHICILGDSNSDVYDRSLYEKIKSIIKPLSIIFKFGSHYKSYVDVKLGKHFFEDKLWI